MEKGSFQTPKIGTFLGKIITAEINEKTLKALSEETKKFLVQYGVIKIHDWIRTLI